MTLLAKEDLGGNYIQAFELPPTGRTTTLALSTSIATTSSLAQGMYRFVSDVSCSVVQGAGATTGDMNLIGGIPEYFHIKEGSIVSAILSTGTGFLAITLC